MLYGVFSDVHSNIEALDAVLGFFADMDVGGYVCCGDIVGYGPDPNPVVERIMGLKNATIICGNHDLAVIGRMEVEWFNAYARAAALWTRDTLKPEAKEYLNGLTARLETPELTVAHGTPRRPPDEYLLSAAQFEANIDHVKTWPLFVGHTHMPVCFTPGKVDFLEHNQSVAVPSAAAIALNPGSVGQPRDHDNRASCGLYDSDKRVYRAVRLDYDLAKTQQKIRDLGLPEFLALRLAFGQ